MSSDSSRQGVLFALSAYTMWGVAPVYFKFVAHIPATQVLSHRVIWSCLFIALLLAVSKQWSKVISVLRNPKFVFTLCVTSLLIGSNWLVFIWAINNNRLLDASLGYYINPLINVVLAMLVLHEKFRPTQWLAVALAAVGVGIQIISYGSVPWVAIALALTFGLYGLLRKKVDLNALPGLFIETALLLPLALVYMTLFAEPLKLKENGLMLSASGIVTTLPLLAFGAAAIRLKLSTLSFFQYIGPSLMFVLATVFYNEPIDTTKIIVFMFIWTGLAVFTWDGIYTRKRQKFSL